MSDELTDERADQPGRPGIFSGCGIASTAFGVIVIGAVVLATLIWLSHRGEVDERAYQTRVLQAAADWTSVLININKDNVDANMRTLHDGTVGELNTDFDSVMEPFRQVVQRLQSRTKGQVDLVAIEALHDPASGPDGAGATPTPPRPELAGVAARTDTVLVVATSVSENTGADKPQTVLWNLRMDVSEVDGSLLISRLEPIR